MAKVQVTQKLPCTVEDMFMFHQALQSNFQSDGHVTAIISRNASTLRDEEFTITLMAEREID